MQIKSIVFTKQIFDLEAASSSFPGSDACFQKWCQRLWHIREHTLLKVQRSVTTDRKLRLVTLQSQLYDIPWHTLKDDTKMHLDDPASIHLTKTGKICYVSLP